MAEQKTMRDEMNDEWMELALENINKLLPEHVMSHINAVLPKILGIVKIAIKKNIKNTAEYLGDDKMFIEMNFPYVFPNGDTIMVPSMFKIDKRQIGPSVYNEATGCYDFALKEGEVPEIQFSLMTLVEKIDKYDKMEDLIKDVKDGTFITIDEIKYTPKDHNIAATEQKQIGSGS